MPRRETQLEMAQRHVREGEERIARQRDLIERLAEHGHPTDEAVKMLQEFQAIQLEHITHLERLRNSE
ncbi:hypothetical protein EN817_11335 [Mesorhizobium sp. M3A.F.Ca.ET.174.01.1.1]|nr:hypothetical protein EJ074_06085 [Mesorhizobium sp. M3A.F.Ca.ET.080.04.2.1]PBB84153.1 hypothetical protein CK216_25465 [Mesorhizobium sp. WSM3876]RWB72316.1 MAG: hypothetical protein EOQ49_12970 [Mesorhizobium sp.]TGS72349.1 hypothetical protein EN844_04800 [Mesorhizobium sp. M3A.F.Ca.ET.201.01.1.1]TGS88004.1 hypothetical protein EN818_11335 [Mesorhizobium sp. M3A.F.Ca.ET.175.01.1.1]TGT28464.1 hypothetical protein EN817_11335 [Mesorhizobium sp. M3A.F.Ca.ET.174.01.1.1]TGT61552.1 hypothetica